MADILQLIGGHLEDGSDASKRFRTFLLDDKWQPEQLGAWLRECMAMGSGQQAYWYRAMQDTAVAIGMRLGFEV